MLHVYICAHIHTHIAMTPYIVNEKSETLPEIRCAVNTFLIPHVVKTGFVKIYAKDFRDSLDTPAPPIPAL